jgi:thioredoxin 1
LADKIKAMATQNFNTLLQSNELVLVDFFAEWCGPCKAMKPILEELKSKVGDKVKIIKIDVDKNPQVAQHFQIRGVPTLMLFKDAKAIWKQSGVHSAQQLKELVDKA